MRLRLRLRLRLRVRLRLYANFQKKKWRKWGMTHRGTFAIPSLLEDPRHCIRAHKELTRPIPVGCLFEFFPRPGEILAVILGIV